MRPGGGGIALRLRKGAGLSKGHARAASCGMLGWGDMHMTPNEAPVWLTQYRGLAGWVRGPKGGGLEEVALAPVEAVSRLPNAAWHGGCHCLAWWPFTTAVGLHPYLVPALSKSR